MSQAAESIFTRIRRGDAPGHVVWSDDRFFAILPLEMINPGHVLLIPKEEVDSVFDLDARDYADLWQRARALAEPLRRVTGARRIAVAVEGFGVPHAHVHLVPVNSGNELNPERAARLPEPDRTAWANRIRSAFGDATKPADAVDRAGG